MIEESAGYDTGIITVSDTSSVNPKLDKSGPLLVEILEDAKKYCVCQTAIVPDDVDLIQKHVRHYADELKLDLIVITGGTGFSERDTTPEAIIPLLTRQTPGITHLLLSSSLAITPFAALSRPVTGIRKNTLIITLPGSPKACKENMAAIINVLPHGLDLIRGEPVTMLHSKIQKDGNEKTSAHKNKHHLFHTCTHDHDEPGHASQTGLSRDLELAVPERARSSPYPMVTVSEAQAIIATFSLPIGTVSCKLGVDMVGRVLAEDLTALENVPGYRASVMDGYAVHVEDGPGTYKVGSISLAAPTTGLNTLQRGQVSRVSTGGPIPPGANAVVMVEDTRLVKTSEDGRQEETVEILVQAKKGENIREIGSDCTVGDSVAKRGQVISNMGGELGLFASVGISSAHVYGEPVVAIMSSGNELREAFDDNGPLAEGQVRDSNRITLSAAVTSAGFDVFDIGIVKDSVESIKNGISTALEEADVIITTGGVSMGEADYMKPILEQKLNAKIHFGRVLMKPGKPTTFATIKHENGKEKLVFALPGNPVSAAVSFHLFVLPALRRISGHPRPENVCLSVKISQDIELDGRPEYHRARVYVSGSDIIAESTGNQQSSRMLSLLAGNGLLELPARSDTLKKLKKGSIVKCIMLGPLY
ncbi:MoaB/Mog domain-containing protein [Phycomyces nitens]|nr:MoaB/Mog domain-containing protein [Phycomyces nitens]